MNWVDSVLQILPSNIAEAQQAFVETREHLDRVIDASDQCARTGRTDKSTDADIVKSGATLTTTLRRFSWAPFSALESAVPWIHRRRLRRCRAQIDSELENIAQLLQGDLSPDKLPQMSVLAVRLKRRYDALDRLASNALASARLSRRIVRWSILVPVVATTVAGVYFYWPGKIDLQSAEILFPPGPYKKSDNDGVVLSSAPADHQSFMREFSLFYFRRNNEFPKLFFQEEARDSSANPSLPEISPAKDTSVASKAATPVTPAIDDMPVGKQNRRARFTSNVQSEVVPKYVPNESLPVPHHRLKFALQNQSSFTTEYVSSIRLRVECINRTEFPWHELTVAPFLSCSWVPSSGHAAIDIRNDGIGPALDVEWSMRAISGLEIARGNFWMIHTHRKVSFPALGDDVGPRSIDYDDERTTMSLSPREFPRPWEHEASPKIIDGRHQLREFFYLMISRPQSDVTSDERYFEHKEQWYEEIRSLERLQEITAVAFDEPFELTVRYKSLKGREFSHRFIDDLPRLTFYYRRKSELCEYDPRNVRTGTYKVAHMVPELRVFTDAIGNFMGYPVPNPKGVDFLSYACELDASHLSAGTSTTTGLLVDRFLNPRGRIALYAKISRPANGRFRTRIQVGRDEIGDVEFDVLSPEILRFPTDYQERLTEVERLKRVFRRGERVPTLHDSDDRTVSDAGPAPFREEESANPDLP